MYTKLLDSAKADAFIINDPLNMRYITGFRGGEGAVYISKDQKVLITDSRYTEAAGKETDFTVMEEKTSHTRFQILTELIGKDGAVTVGYEDKALRVSEFAQMNKEIKCHVEWIPLEGRVDALRRIKTKAELDSMQAAASIADAAFLEILKIIRPGMTEKEGAAELEYLMKKRGAEGTSFDTIFASGINTSMPHAIPSDKKMEMGDFITMDFGCKVDGYCSDMTRTIVLGMASEKQTKLYELVLRAQLNAIDSIRPGIMCKEGDKAARDIIAEAGYGDCFGHGLGHSVGLAIHEGPNLNTRDETILQPGMIETVEPGVYIPGFGGVRIEDIGVVTENGFRLLSKAPKALIQLER